MDAYQANTEKGRVEKWKTSFWDVDSIPWHMPSTNPILEKHWSSVTGGRTGLRVFFPLCGASVDLAWLYRQNHTVVGVEGVRKAADKLFAEADVEYSVTRVTEVEGWKYQSLDLRLTVFVADFFKITPDIVGAFDAVFDRGSLEAMQVSDRAEYISTMKPLLGESFIYLLSGFDYQPGMKDSPPRPLPPAVVEQLFGTFSSIELLDRVEQQKVAANLGVQQLFQCTYKIGKK
eukprot:GFUD01037332.1.p1 GENE.GFUD01037332.1~~GFUD01037332.1.p1  ORF type:complete len:232 (+),score=79.13 GFUD01037332.1:52-747(+)